MDSQLPLHTLLPLRMMFVTLVAVRDARTNFFHQPALMAFLRFLAGSPEGFDRYIRIDTPESGRILYQPGDYYRFTLIGLAGGDKLLDVILKRLTSLPGSVPKDAEKIPFRDNWRLYSVQDGFSTAAVHQLSDLSLYDWPQLQKETRLWAAESAFTWRWLSPARILKDKVLRKGLSGEARYCRDRSDLTSGLLLCRLRDGFADLLRRRGESPTGRQPPPAISIDNAHLFWLDAAYRGAKGSSKATGGMGGRIQFNGGEALSSAWWERLVLGQYVGTGQNTAFGWGRYQLVTLAGVVSYRRVFPASSMLDPVMKEGNLAGAWRHVMSKSEPPLSLDEADPGWQDQYDWDDDPSEVPFERLVDDVNKLIAGRYSPPCLRGRLLPKCGGGVRALAIPPAYDRVLQRAVAQQLTPALDQLMYRHSYGYRRGRSRINARYAIQSAWRAGYRWVFESDIADFFGSVDLRRLRERLQAIYGEDPVIEAIIAWMSADVEYEGEVIKRKNGLPQGSPLSPLMANLMLDDFDSDMEKAGFHLIRFADDFVVLCKNPQQAQAAGDAALRSLGEHGLELNPGKTRIADMSDGFRYLGYLFMNDMALDVGGTDAGAVPPAAAVPPASWLAQLGLRKPSKLHAEEAADRLAAQLESGTPKHLIGERDDNGTLLTLTGVPAVVSTLNDNLRVHRKDKLLYHLPWHSLQAVLLFGNHQVTTQAAHAAMSHNVPIHLSSGGGHYHGVMASNRAQHGEQLWLRQLEIFRVPQNALACSRAIVAARLAHMKDTVRRRRNSADALVFERAQRRVEQFDSLESLRGLEGSATRDYYQQLAALLPASFGFSGRNRRPPIDPFNVLLSIGYTVLYGYSQSVLQVVGLLPRQGFYHQVRGRHAALASDLMEPFRHLVERSALTVVSRHEITHDDFILRPDGRCIIDDQARRRFLTLLLTRWETTVKCRGESQPKNHFTHLYQQALSLKDFIRGKDEFKAWRVR